MNMRDMDIENLRKEIEHLYSIQGNEFPKECHTIFHQFKHALNRGKVRIAEKYGQEWKVNNWVKKGILLGFRLGRLSDFSLNKGFVYYDKHTYPLKKIKLNDNIRLVPGGSSIRDGCFVSSGVICMPPMYVNVGAYVDSGTMIDSHALVGSCAQIGKRVHLSAAAQIGGVLEPVGALPVIIEDDVFIGGNCGIFEGTMIRTGAIIGAGSLITASTPVFDLVKKSIYRKTDAKPLEIPANAVVVPGSRRIANDWATDQGLSIQTPIIVKYRDEKSTAAAVLEDLLR